MSDIQQAAHPAHPTPEKIAQVESLNKIFTDAKAFFLIDFTGLDSVKTTELRRRVRASAGRYLIAKNTLSVRAAKGTSAEAVSALFKGTTGLAVGGDDSAILAKALSAFQKENAEGFKVKGGVYEGAAFTGKQLDAIAALPTKDQVRSMLIGILQAPASKLARLLVTPGTQLARCVGEKSRQPESKPQAPVAAAKPAAEPAPEPAPEPTPEPTPEPAAS